jgi:hypothetical protein
MAAALKQIYATPQGMEFNTRLDEEVYNTTIEAIDKMVANLKSID